MIQRKFLIAIPAFNEETTIQKTISTCQIEFPEADLLIVNDCSTDGTLRFISESKVDFLDLPFNLGVGGAMRAAFQFAKINNYSHLVQVYADGQHNPGEIEHLVSKSNRFDVVIGSRFLADSSYELGFIRKQAISAIRRYLNLIIKVKLTDPTSGFRLSNRRAIEFFSDTYPIEYLGDTVGSIVLGKIAGLSIGECGIQMNRRQGGTPSQNTMKSITHLARTLITISMMRLGKSLTEKEVK
jgi:glycosyltransferase involved in cell wall biosynthesis